METTIAEASSMFPGFRFSPTDEELIDYYLKKKIEGTDNCVEIIPEVDICKYEPWDLPAKSIIRSDNEWFFFSPRGRKYPNGSQSRRATECGYWKATGRERNVKSGSSVIGTKRTLVFHTGRAPKGQRTEWIMHEYCMSEKSQDLMVVCRLRKNSDFHLDETPQKKSPEQSQSSTMDDIATALSVIEQTGVNEGAMAGECSKECSSSFNSQLLELVDAGVDSDDKITSEFPPNASSSQQKVQVQVQECGSSDEDCFADIMKDDIIELDDSLILPMVTGESESKNKDKQPEVVVNDPALPFQGTANRRLRLRRQNAEAHEAVPHTAHELKNVTYAKELADSMASQRSSKGLMGFFSTMGIKQWAMLICLTLLVLFFLFLRVTELQFKVPDLDSSIYD